MSEDLNKLRELATNAADIAPGAWDHDTDNNDGAYGAGPDARHGFSSYFMMDDKGRRLFDSYNSEVAEVHEDDESAWDENSRRLFDYLAAFNPATALSLIARLQAAEERAEKAEGDRDALRAAIGFKPGPLKDDRDDDIVIIDAKALRPAMVEARRQRDDAQSKLWDSHAHAAEEIRAWVKERFGKWITHKTAWTLADRIFGSERAALKTEGA